MREEYTYREHRVRTVMNSKIPIFVNTNTTRTPTYIHHVGVYGITGEEALFQMKLGNVKNRDVVHYSSELIVDTDNIETAEKVRSKLCKENISFELYKLNNFKFFLQRAEEDEPSNIMCYQDKQYVNTLLSDCNVNNGLDLNIYAYPFHICRTKTSFHEVTGAKTQLVEIFKGNLISTNQVELRKYDKPISYRNVCDPDFSDWSQIQYVIGSLYKIKTNCHLTIWMLGKDISKFCSLDTGLELALVYAKSVNYCLEKATRAFKQGYENAEYVI